MGSLTRRQRLRLAREARKLAMECVEGTAPPLAVGHFSASFDESRCAIGWCCHRAEVKRPGYALWMNDGPGGDWLPGVGAVLAANDGHSDSERHAAVVFPLLALADALEEAQP